MPTLNRAPSAMQTRERVLPEVAAGVGKCVDGDQASDVAAQIAENSLHIVEDTPQVRGEIPQTKVTTAQNELTTAQNEVTTAQNEVDTAKNEVTTAQNGRNAPGLNGSVADSPSSSDCDGVDNTSAVVTSVVRRVPDWIRCPLTGNVMVEPVVLRTGDSYERKAILNHIEMVGIEPKTDGEYKESDGVYQNRVLEDIIAQWKKLSELCVQ